MNGEPVIGGADQVVVLDGNEATIRPTLEMAQAFSRGVGGLRGAINRCGNLDMDTIVQVIGMGTAISKNPKMRGRLEQAVYEAGLNKLAVPCIAILESLAFGGRKPPTSDEVTGDGDEEGPDEGPLAASA